MGSVPSQITNGIRVSVESHLSPQHSNPSRSVWFFVYEIEIENQGEDTVQLLTRYWKITDAHGEVEEVRGPGVVGEQPTLGPGQRFRYNSGCPLPTPFGSMEGSYHMKAARGEDFDVAIPPFALRDPSKMQ